jgi:hypothetical protein
VRGFAAWLLFAVLSMSILACASSKAASDAAVGGDEDAAVPADAAGTADAGVDAAVAAAPVPGAEVVSTAGTVRSGPVIMDVEIGHFVDQAKVSHGTRTLEGAAVIKP